MSVRDAATRLLKAWDAGASIYPHLETLRKELRGEDDAAAAERERLLSIAKASGRVVDQPKET